MEDLLPKKSSEDETLSPARLPLSQYEPINYILKSSKMMYTPGKQVCQLQAAEYVAAEPINFPVVIVSQIENISDALSSLSISNREKDVIEEKELEQVLVVVFNTTNLTNDSLKPTNLIHYTLTTETCYESKEIYGLDDSDCVVCLTEPKCVTLLPCRHFCVCHNCAMRLEKSCPVCRSKIVSFIKFSNSNNIPETPTEKKVL